MKPRFSDMRFEQIIQHFICKAKHSLLNTDLIKLNEWLDYTLRLYPEPQFIKEGCHC